jgi:hypothetical protein
MLSNLTTSEIALKVINICLLLILLLIKLFGDTKTQVNEHEVKEEEKKDINTWYPINDEQSRYKGEWKGGVPHRKGTKKVFEADSS